MKSLSAIGVALAALSWTCMIVFQNSDPAATVGWSYLSIMYLLAFSIVVFVKTKKK